ncbi:glycoside hydrolase family 18 protein [Pleomassaria siparia CBS 279.74]|uniref:chitinase n=1 Tax=Pleomassaria siparia CBS 279.74 TaxID=1314801 RepID=A0A6G1JSJ9_9PLEO|nr:glycoside hydrolase family 18 protein [Pleomassaria siparia CBS 279.74]
MRLNRFLTFSAIAGYGFATLNPSSNSTVAIYWGQNSAGNAEQDTTLQNRLSSYCKDSNVNIILIAFLLEFNGGVDPTLNFANQANDCLDISGTGKNTYQCSEIEEDIKTCQEQGKTVLLSFGGSGSVEAGFATKEKAVEAAKSTWALFGPVNSTLEAKRPFKSAVVDGFDFDFESKVSFLVDFTKELRALMDQAAGGQKYYLSAAPQCQIPDANLGDVLGEVSFDFVNVQFYNNDECGVSSFVPNNEQQSIFNFKEWDTWATTKSKNKAVKILLGVLAGETGGRGYVSPDLLDPIINYSSKFASFGGVMMWDASQAWNNADFIKKVKDSLTD